MSDPQRVIGDRYVVLGELGRGGMGVVWRAEDKVIGRQVAIKELRLPESGEGAAVFQERVLREVRTGGRLNDPAVVTVFDVINTDDGTFIVMELVEAPTLSDIIKQRGPLPPEQIATIGEQVLSALNAAHQSGIVHRDVKPGNVMVAPNGRVKLTDFGIAQATDDPRLTTTGFLVGSPSFMAPERVAGKDAGPPSDLWSLGVTLFYAAEGLVPFERGTTAATLHAIMNEVPYLTRTQGPLAAAIMGMLVSSPDARISAAQAQGLLQTARNGVGMHTPPAGNTAVYAGQTPTAIAPVGASSGKKKALAVGATVGALLLLAGGGAAGAWLASPSDSQREDTWTYGDSGDVPVLEGSNDCYNVQLKEGALLKSESSESCDEPHHVEFFGSTEVLGQSAMSSTDLSVEYPGEDHLARIGEAYCATVFDSNLMEEQRKDGVSYRTLVPTEKAWDAKTDTSEGERKAYCVAFASDGGQLQGPLRKDAQ